MLEHEQSIREEKRVGRIVGDEEPRSSERLQLLAQEPPHDRASRHIERRERFEKMETADKDRFEFYRLTLDDLEAEELPKVDREKDAEAFMRRAKGEAEDLDDTPLWPSGLDPVKREGLSIVSDLIDLTEAARTAGVLPKS